MSDSKPRRGLGANVHRPSSGGGGTATHPRLAALSDAVREARGRLDDGLLDEVEAIAARSAERMTQSSAHTVVVIAGATGSGKSTTFNALVGAELSASSAQRPTTASPMALVWSDDDATELLDWLQIPPGRRHVRSQIGTTVARDRLPDGLVLLDLPDHDSLNVTHHEEAHRVVALADMLIWVVDPQKYADAAIHREFLRPLAGHRDVTMVVLNHIDTLPEESRPVMLRDLKRVLAADGIKDARVLGISAREGIGMAELRTAIRRRVEEKRNMALRVEADLAVAAGRLQSAAGDGLDVIPDAWVGDLERQVLEAAGVPTMLARAKRLEQDRVARAARPPWRLPPAAEPIAVGALDRAAVAKSVRALADNVTRDLAPGWGGPIRAAMVDDLDATCGRPEAELINHAVSLEGRSDAHRARLGGLAAAAAALALVAAGAVLGLTGPPVLGAVLAGVGLLVGFIGMVVLPRRLAVRAAEVRGREIDEVIRMALSRVLRQQVIDATAAHRASFGRFRVAATVASGGRDR